jgi:ankyrin repeat protein
MAENSVAADGSLPEPTLAAELLESLRQGDPDKVRAVIEAGADIRYKRDHGYDALLDAVHGCDERLLEILALLVEHGVDLSGVSSYGESGLRVLSRLGRFDAVRFLLKAGADKSQLGWTPLMEAVAIGSVADVRAALARGAALEEQDWWERTAWLIALLTGDVARAALLRDYGANTAACGRCGQPPLFYAIKSRNPHLLRWLIREGADVHLADEFGNKALVEAVGEGDLECVEILLDAGADIGGQANGTALGRAWSRAIILRLLEAGADPADANVRVLLGLSYAGADGLAAVAPDEFRRTFTRSFGQSNPERMRVPFWEAMVRCGVSANEARSRFEADCGPLDGPVWCAHRYGQSWTLLPDGRAVQIGGEHEDWYDPEFCIYNDVFFHEPGGSVAIYGYPESVFPPTDFHTATLIGDFVYVIGSLGYAGTRRYGETPLYRLDVRTFRMDRLNACGEAPGWISSHRAVAVGLHAIRVWGGDIFTETNGKEFKQENASSFVLDLDRLRWTREGAPGPQPRNFSRTES